ncbi:MAG: carbonic anhydrase [Desulfovibrionaceae bacterium]
MSVRNVLWGALAFLLAASMAWAGVAGNQKSGAEALAMLKEGNARFVAGKAVHPRAASDRLAATASGQHPFATVLTCSDSRVPPEILFDQGVGDLFVVRVAGNVIGQDVQASIEYGVEHLHTPLLLILGHTHCGAVTAAVQAAEAEGAIPALLWKIQPAARWAKAHGEGDVVERAIERNVQLSLQEIQFASPVTRTLIEQGKLKAVGAIYDLASGKVRWLNF